MATRRTKTRRSARVHRHTSRTKANRQWSREEIAFMRKYYRGYETAWVARQLHRTVYSIRYKAVDLSLKKSNPSVWKGRKGAANAFKPGKSFGYNSRPTSRKATSRRRSTHQRSWKAQSTRKNARKARSRRSTRRTR